MALAESSAWFLRYSYCLSLLRRVPRRTDRLRRRKRFSRAKAIEAKRGHSPLGIALFLEHYVLFLSYLTLACALARLRRERLGARLRLAPKATQGGLSRNSALLFSSLSPCLRVTRLRRREREEKRRETRRACHLISR